MIEAVSQDGYCGVALGQCLTVGIDVDTIGQSTDNQHFWAMSTQVADETTYQVYTILRTLTGTNDADYLGLVQVGITFII